MAEIVNGLPNIFFTEKDSQTLSSNRQDCFAPVSNIEFDKIQSGFGVALHMHQPTIPAATGDLYTAGLISNLQFMMEHQDQGDNHNAPVFMQCYSRMSDIIRELVAQGQSNPAYHWLMFDYLFQ